MTNDIGADYAAEIAAQFIAGSGINAPPSDVFLTLYNDAGQELNASLENGRQPIPVPSGFEQGADPTQFQNANSVSLGEASGEITVQEFALKREDAADGTATEYFRADVTNAPQTFADATEVFFEAGTLTVNLLDKSND